MRGWEELKKRGLEMAALLLFFAVLFLSADFLERDGANRNVQEAVSDVCRIRMTYPVVNGVSDISDLEDVQKAVNRISGKEIGVEVELVPVDMAEAKEEYYLWLSRGDTLDLMLVRNQDIRPYVDKGLLNSLSGYLERNADVIWHQDMLLDEALTKGAKQQGKIYGISNISRQNAAAYGLWISEKVLEETQTEYREDHVYSLAEIDRLLVELKSLYPDSYPLGQITARQTGSSVSYYMDVGNALGGELLTGTVQSGSNTVKNFFASPEYQQFLSYMERWYRSGFIYPDSVIYDAPVQKLLEDGTVMMLPASAYPGTIDLMLGRETDFVCLRMTEIREKGIENQDFWTVPSTSRYPAEAVKFLELLYQDQRISYLLNVGISGTHYRIADAAENLLELLKDEDGGTNGFYNPFAQIGDVRELYTFGTKEQQAVRLEFQKQALEEDNRYDGFVYSTTNVSRQADAVQKVVDIYVPLLESGSVDLQTNYKEFLDELEEAGIQKIIEDKQAQLDAWQAQNNGTEEEKTQENGF